MGTLSLVIWSGLSNDIRFAVRQARKRALFSAACIAVLALGLGANTAIFSVLYSAVFQPLPYRDPGQLVAVHNRFPLLNLPRLGTSSLDYLDLREHRELFADAGAYYYLDLNRTGIDIPVKVNAVAATSSLFRTLGVQPLLGRLFNVQEQRYHGPHAVILSEDYWRTAFGADPEILNRSLLLDGELYPVIGVMPGWFQVPNNVTQMWAPVAFSPRQLEPGARQNHYLTMYARLVSGLTFAQASARMEQLSRRMAVQHPEDYPLDRLGWRFFLQPLAQDNDGSERVWLFTLFAAVTCLLLIVGTNIAGLLVVRSTERQFDISVRMALGASRFRVARQVVAEVLVLAFFGGVAAVFVARVALNF
jgi:predicted permease